MIFERDPHRLFGVPREHALELTGRTERTRGGRVREVRWFVERDPAGAALARYRCCDERVALGVASGNAAARDRERRLTWERYALDGTVQARELRRVVDASDAVAVH